MFDSAVALIVYREVLEIAMILGVVLAATRGLAGRNKWIGLGFIGGLAGAGCVAVFASTISSMAEGMGQEFFNAIILFAAALVIGWTVLWMRTHAREMSAHMKKIGQEVCDGKLPGITLSLVIGLAMLREGAEIVLFLYGQILQEKSLFAIANGALGGLMFGTITGGLLYVGLIKMSSRYMLKVTSWLLILLVAGLSAQGAEFLSAAGYFPNLSSTVWNSSWLLSDHSLVGQALHTLIGYTAQPTAIGLIFYGGTLALLIGLIAFTERKKPLVIKVAI
jgi:high-affinity iron transporter